ncbi:MAG: HD domain-containing protein, partial [Pseudomonadota bacterium]
ALLLAEHADRQVDKLRAAAMALVHDIVEIEAGDSYVYDAEAAKDKPERERRAADRLFSMLPPDQATEMRSLWEEFEAGRTPEAAFASAIDRLIPILLNLATEGRSWREHGTTADMVLARNAGMAQVSAKLWGVAQTAVREAVNKGYLAPEAAPRTE